MANKEKFIRSENQVNLYNVVSDEAKHIVDHDTAKEMLQSHSVKLSDDLQRLQKGLGIKNNNKQRKEINPDVDNENEAVEKQKEIEPSAPLIDVKRDENAYKKENAALTKANDTAVHQFNRIQNVQKAEKPKSGTDTFTRTIFYDNEQNDQLKTDGLQTIKREYMQIKSDKQYKDTSPVVFPAIHLRKDGFHDISERTYKHPKQVPSDQDLVQILSELGFDTQATDENINTINTFLHYHVPNMFVKHKYHDPETLTIHQIYEQTGKDLSETRDVIYYIVAKELERLFNRLRNRITNELDDIVVKETKNITDYHFTTETYGFSMQPKALANWIFVDYLDHLYKNSDIAFLLTDSFKFNIELERLSQSESSKDQLTQYTYQFKYMIDFKNTPVYQ